MKTRHLTNIEKQIIYRLLSNKELLRREFERDVDDYRVRDLDEFGSISFVYATPTTSQSTEHGLAAAGSHEDTLTTGAETRQPRIQYLLFYELGRPSELQIYREDGRKITSHLRPSRIELE